MQFPYAISSDEFLKASVRPVPSKLLVFLLKEPQLASKKIKIKLLFSNHVHPNTLFFFYKNIEAEICEILRIF